jgi:hypothetical protein
MARDLPAALRARPSSGTWSSTRDADDKPYSAPGWWKPLAIGWFVVLVLFVAYASIENGFKWGMLLVFPILGGAFALGILFLRALGERVRDQ